MLTCPNTVRMGTMKIPLAIPSIPPRALAPSDTAKSQSANPLSIYSTLLFYGRLRRSTSRQMSDEPDLVAAVIKSLVINRLVSGGISGPLNQKDRATFADTERLRYSGVSGNSFQLILSSHQRQIVFLLKQRKDGFDFKIVFNHLLANVPGQIRFVERERHAVRQTHALNSHHQRPRGKGKLVGNRFTGGNDLLIQQTGARMAAQRMHIFHKAA